MAHLLDPVIYCRELGKITSGFNGAAAFDPGFTHIAAKLESVRFRFRTVMGWPTQPSQPLRFESKEEFRRYSKMVCNVQPQAVRDANLFESGVYRDLEHEAWGIIMEARAYFKARSEN